MEAAQSTLNRELDRDLVTWTAPSRPFQRHGRQYFVTIFAMAGIVSLILFLADNSIMPVVLIVALVFLFYVLSTVSPENIEYKITTKGVKVAGTLTEWAKLFSFGFGTRMGSEVLVFKTSVIPGRMEIVINPEIKEQLTKEISSYIPFEEIPVTRFDKAVSWFSQRLPENK